MQPPETTISSYLEQLVRTLESSETEFSLKSTLKQIVTIELNEDYYMTTPQLVASAINETEDVEIVNHYTCNHNKIRNQQW